MTQQDNCGAAITPELRARLIADDVVPQYRNGVRSYGCGSWIAKMWGSAYEAALLAVRSAK